MAIQADYYARVQSARASSLLLKLVEELFVTPAITVTRAARALGVGYTSAQKNVKKLVKARILREVGGAARNRVFLAEGVLRAIEGPAGKDVRPPRTRRTTKKRAP